MKAVVYWFSGTGNTRIAVRRLAAGLQAAGWSVDEKPIIGGSAVGADAAKGVPDMTVFSFPVLGWAAPSVVRAFAKRLPRVKEAKAAVMATWGGGPGSCMDRFAAILRRRGYDVVATGGAVYPVNWTQVANPPSAEDAKLIIDLAAPRIDALADTLARGERSFYRSSPGMAVVTAVVSPIYLLIGRRGLAKLNVADLGCDGCGLCARECPGGVIRMSGGRLRRPRWGFDCIGCGRCINSCRRTAIQVSAVKAVIHLSLNVAVLIAAIAGGAALGTALTHGSVLAVPLAVALASGFAAVGTIAQFTAFDRLLFLLERIPGFNRAFALGWTQRFRRYMAP